MARKKSYYTVDEITNNLYTFGNEWMLTDGTEYTGLYHTYSTGETYTLASWNETLSQQLLPYQDINQDVFIYQQISNVTTTYKSFVSIIPTVNQDAITKGYFYRYIVKKNNEMLFYETTQDDFNKWNLKQIDNNLYTMIKLKWTIKGDLQDTKVAGVLVPSVSTINSLAIKSVENFMPGLSSYLTNLTEFYIGSTYIIATDINGLE
jgi:hypothetical protein